MAEAEVEVRLQQTDGQRPAGPDWEALHRYLDGLESTQVSPLVPMLLGMLLGIAVPILLLLASL